MKRLLFYSFLLLWVVSACSKEDNDPILTPRPNEEPTTTDTVPSSQPDPEPELPPKAVAVMRITTEGRHSVQSKEFYLACNIQIDGMGLYADYQTPTLEVNDGKTPQTDSIRGRGNSTWDWYPKKPYKLKLGKKASLLGIPEGKKYVLLANYRDPTRMMNAVTFDMARYLGLPYTCTNRFVELYVNDQYQGLYQLTEQIEQGKGRVAIDKHEGLLLSLDLDDGPTLQPHATDNFLSEVFHSSYSPHGLPVCVKHPSNPTSDQLQTIRHEFAQLEQVIQNRDYEKLCQVCDVQSMIDFLFIQELTRNVELVTPRSMYLIRDADHIWRFGPVWDFDGGFAYDWAETHNYFGSQSWMMGPHGDRDIPDFFDLMLEQPDFRDAYRTRWNEVGTHMVDYALQQMTLRLDTLQEAIGRDEKNWPICRKCSTECTRLKSWLNLRAMRYTDLLNSGN